MSITEAAENLTAQGDSAARPARDPVNRAMVNNWVEALGDTNPLYVEGDLAPPAMVQVWTMNGLHGERAEDDPLGAAMSLLDDEGFTSVVATNSEQTYHRYLRIGEHVSASTRLEGVAGPKWTALGEGWFVTTRTTWFVGEEPVAEMMFRVLKFRPPDSVPGAVLQPVISQDTEFFWAGLNTGELRIQRWGSTLRHPPGPMPPDGDLAQVPDYVVATGRGRVYSYVVHHAPAVPGKVLPFVVALVELDEGVRMVGELLDVRPEDVHIGLPVEVVFSRIDDELTLPAWRVAR